MFDLYDDATLVTAVSQVKQQQESNTLILDGETLELKVLKVDGQDWQDYSVGEASLEIRGLPSEFTLTVVTKINPQANTALEGLYKSGGAFCTQCEAEAFAALLIIWIVRMFWRVTPQRLLPIKRNILTY